MYVKENMNKANIYFSCSPRFLQWRKKREKAQEVQLSVQWESYG